MAAHTKGDVLSLVSGCFMDCGYTSFDGKKVEQQLTQMAKALKLTYSQIYDIVNYWLVIRLVGKPYAEALQEKKKCLNRVTFLTFSNVREEAQAYYEKQAKIDEIRKSRKKQDTAPTSRRMTVTEKPTTRPIGVYYSSLD